MKQLLQSPFLTRFLVVPLWLLLDRLVVKSEHYWGFPVHFSDASHFIENTRAVFEHVKTDPNIRKVIFYRGNKPDLRIEDAANLTMINLQTAKGLWLLMRCRVLFVANAISWDFTLRWQNDTRFVIIPMNLKIRKVVNVWHGIPLKKIVSLWNDTLRKRYNRIAYRCYERTHYHALIASSKIDSYVMANVFYPLPHQKVLVSGLPRNDFLLKPINQLPSYLKEQHKRIQDLCKGRRLVLYAPTHRQTRCIEGSGYYNFSAEEASRLKALLKEHSAVLGVRMHYSRKGINVMPPEELIDGDTVIDVGNRFIPEIAPLIREATWIITDYSSLYIDALYLNKPVFSFAYDLEHYRDQQDGLLYDMHLAFPGPVVQTFDELLQSLRTEMALPEQHTQPRYQHIRSMFFDYFDDQNTRRLLDFLQCNS